MHDYVITTNSCSYNLELNDTNNDKFIITLENKVRDLKVDLAEIAIEKDLFKEDTDIKNKLNEIRDLNEQISVKKTEIDLLK